MKIRYAMVTIVLALCSQVARAEQPPDRFRLIGTTVYSSDGADIGTIADVRLDEAGRLASLRINAGTRLGFGVHQVELPGSSVTIVRGVATVDVPKEAVEMLPSVKPGEGNSE